MIVARGVYSCNGMVGGTGVYRWTVFTRQGSKERSMRVSEQEIMNEVIQ